MIIVCTIPDNTEHNTVHDASIDQTLTEWNCQQIFWYQRDNNGSVADLFNKLIQSLSIDLDEFECSKALRGHRRSLPNNRLYHERSKNCTIM